MFHQKWGIFTREIPWGAPEASASLAFLKHTTIYNIDNDLMGEYETDWTRSASPDMRSLLPHLMCACKHSNINLSLYY